MNRAETNRTNAQRSTGPRTDAGKGRSSRNALQHGLRSASPLVPGESPAQYDRYQQGILQSLSPAGHLETELAGRVALSLWRLRRVGAFEAAITALGQEEAVEAVRDAHPSLFLSDDQKAPAHQLEKVREALERKRETVGLWEGTLDLLRRLPELPDESPLDGNDVYGLLEDVAGELPSGDDFFDVEDRRFLAGVGVPPDEVDDAWHWGGWGAGAVRLAVGRMAAQYKACPQKLLARSLHGREQIQAEGKAECVQLEREAANLEARLQALEGRARIRRLLPEDRTLEKVMRYEAHLSRQMLQAMHTLERLQANRAGADVPLPAVLDVTVNGDGTASPLLTGPA